MGSPQAIWESAPPPAAELAGSPRQPRAGEQLSALLLVQWRSFIRRFRQREGRRGALASAAVTTVWYLLWAAAAIVSAATPSLVGREDVEAVLPGVLFAALLYWQLVPLMTLSLGASLELGKLRLYPVPLPVLFAVECLLRLGAGAEMVLVTAGVLLGLALAGSPHLAGLAAAFVLFALFNVLLSAGVRNLVERIFQGRRLREAVLVVLVAVTLTPQVLVWSDGARRFAGEVMRGAREIPYWVFPSGLAARLGVGEGSPADAAWFLLLIGAAGVFAYRQFRHIFESGAVGAAVAPGKSGAIRYALGRFSPLRLLPDPLSALVEKEVVYLWRSPRFRLPFFMGFTFGVIAWYPIMRRWEEAFGGWMEQSAVILISLYGFLLLGPVLFINRFGFDRESARFYFWLPIGFGRLLFSKNLATLTYGWIEIALIGAVCRLLGLQVGWTQMVDAFVAGTIALVFLLSVGNYMSVRFPAPSNPDRVSRAGGSHGLRAAVQFFVFPVALGPVVGGLCVREWAGAEWYGMWIAATAFAGLALYALTFFNCRRYGAERSEMLVTALAGGHGPVSAE